MSKKAQERPPDGLWGSRLRQVREGKGWGQTELAFKAEMNAAEVSRYETGGRQPIVPALARLCRALGVSADYLLGLSDDPRPPAAR